MEKIDHLAGLNEAQKHAVQTTEGPLLVIAGAGSGKTRVITHRIVQLIENGVAPANILAVTFTNKAAKEMRERVDTLIHTYSSSDQSVSMGLPTVTTFHSLGVRILREFHLVMGVRKHFTIFDRSDSLRAIKKGIELAGYSPKQFEPRSILSIISRAKGDARHLDSYGSEASSYIEQVTAEVWRYYAEALQQEQAFDFDDLLLKTLLLLRSHPPVLQTLQERFRYIHIDEYQDTNKVQFEIARLLAAGTHNICAVGDIDQNIYSWRGADIQNVLQFERYFPEAVTVVLEENYRSTKTIITVSNEIIEKNRNRVPKNVFTSNQEGEKITVFGAYAGSEEAEYVATTAHELVSKGVPPSNIAVLYRTNFQSRALEEAFLELDIPYQLLGTKFFERKEIKHVLSYLRLALNPESTSDLSRVINEPTRGIGKVTLLKLTEGNRGALRGATAEKVDRFYQIISDIADTARTQPLAETIKFVIQRTGMETALKKEGTDEDLMRLENLQELVSLATRYNDLDPEEAVSALLESAALQSDQDELATKDERDAVRLMTIHAAKGLEFAYVFITGLEEGLFPHERLDDSRIDMEEERRLFYVALTRAEKKLYLTFAHTRTIYGSQRVNIPSSFLADISEEHLDEIRGTNVSGTSLSGFERTIFLD